MDEELYENPNVAPPGNDLHQRFCGGKSELQKDWEKLPDE
jgi:hypothetical protein